MNWMRWMGLGFVFHENVLTLGFWNINIITSIVIKKTLVFLVDEMYWMRWMRLGYVFHKNVLMQRLWSLLLSQISIVIVDHTALLSEVVYMSDKILQLAIGSCDLSQDENRFTVVYKLSKFTKWQPFSLKTVKVVNLWVAQLVKN